MKNLIGLSLIVLFSAQAFASNSVTCSTDGLEQNTQISIILEKNDQGILSTANVGVSLSENDYNEFQMTDIYIEKLEAGALSIHAQDADRASLIMTSDSVDLNMPATVSAHIELADKTVLDKKILCFDTELLN